MYCDYCLCFLYVFKICLIYVAIRYIYTMKRNLIPFHIPTDTTILSIDTTILIVTTIQVYIHLNYKNNTTIILTLCQQNYSFQFFSYGSLVTLLIEIDYFSQFFPMISNSYICVKLLFYFKLNLMSLKYRLCFFQ